MWLPDLTERTLEPEIMDDPQLNTDAHEKALASLSFINWLSLSDSIVWRPIRELASQLDRPLRVLDVASGAGDVLLRLSKRASRANVELELFGLDFSEKAIAFAEQRIGETSHISFGIGDALRDPLPTGYDVVMCSLFLHHLTNDEAESFLRSMKQAAGMAVLVNDLRRSTVGYSLAWLVSRTLSRSPVVHTDALLSVRSAFTTGEVKGIAQAAGMPDPTIRNVWPFRFLLDWRPNA